ncbi:DUF1461 domain-containing protein [Candidatus Woesearchaeota archaeon]|nr:DUF1461 domain-containing protein [Candidatus Woesearchaeota archaeon]
MQKETTVIIALSILLPLCFLLLSYKITIAVFPLTTYQEATLDVIQNGITPEETAPLLNYTALELSHVTDVRKVMNGINIFLGFLLMGTLSLLFYSRNNPLILQKSLRYGGIATIGILIMVLLFSFLDFTTLFTWFHQLFFPQGNWSFPADSLLIQTFPAEFFVNISRSIFLLALVLGIGAFLGSRIWSTRT